MLTSDLALSWRKGRAIGPRLVDPRDASLVAIAASLIDLVASHRGLTRGALDEALDGFVGDGTDYKVLRGLIKLLDDRSTFAVGAALEPVDVRRIVFLASAQRAPLTPAGRAEVIAAAAASLGSNPEAVELALFADLSENEVLVELEPIEPAALLEAYNLAQAQALLYRAVRMTLSIEPQPAEGYRAIFDAIKKYRLIHTIEGTPTRGYLVRLDGPVSMFHRSQKYGIQMAVFLPALLSCTGWSMEAEIDVKTRGPAFYTITSKDRPLATTYERYGANKRPLVEKLLAGWPQHAGALTLEESREVLDFDGEAFVPDLVVTAPDGRRVFVEALGFWTPKTLATRLGAFERASFRNVILVASEEFLASRDEPVGLPSNVVIFKSSLDPRAVRAAAERLLS